MSGKHAERDLGKEVDEIKNQLSNLSAIQTQMAELIRLLADQPSEKTIESPTGTHIQYYPAATSQEYLPRNHTTMVVNLEGRCPPKEEVQKELVATKSTSKAYTTNTMASGSQATQLCKTVCDCPCVNGYPACEISLISLLQRGPKRSATDEAPDEESRKKRNESLFLPHSYKLDPSIDSSPPPPPFYTNKPTAPSSRPAKSPRDDRPFPSLSIAKIQLYHLLKDKGLISPKPRPRVRNPLPPWYKPNNTCIFHSNAPGHSLENCATFRCAVLRLIDTNQISVESQTASNG